MEELNEVVVLAREALVLCLRTKAPKSFNVFEQSRSSSLCSVQPARGGGGPHRGHCPRLRRTGISHTGAPISIALIEEPCRLLVYSIHKVESVQG